MRAITIAFNAIEVIRRRILKTILVHNEDHEIQVMYVVRHSEYVEVLISHIQEVQRRAYCRNLNKRFCKHRYMM